MQKKLANFEGFLFNQFFCQRYKGGIKNLEKTFY